MPMMSPFAQHYGQQGSTLASGNDLVIPPPARVRQQMGPPTPQSHLGPQTPQTEVVEGVVEGGAAGSTSPFREFLLNLIQQGQQQQGQQQGPMPEMNDIDFEGVRNSLSEMGEPKMPSGPMSPEERRAFLMDWGMRGLAASGQPFASVAGSMGGAGVQALEGHRGRRADEGQRNERMQDRERQRVMDMLGIDTAQRGVQERDFDRAERRQDRDASRQDSAEARAAQAAMALFGDESRNRPQPQLLQGDNGYFWGTPGQSQATPISGPEGNPLRPRGTDREFEIDRRYNMAKPMFEAQGMTSEEADMAARETALRASGRMSPEEALESRRKTAMALIQSSRDFERASATERQIMLRRTIIGVEAMEKDLLGQSR